MVAKVFEGGLKPEANRFKVAKAIVLNDTSMASGKPQTFERGPWRHTSRPLPSHTALIHYGSYQSTRRPLDENLLAITSQIWSAHWSFFPQWESAFLLLSTVKKGSFCITSLRATNSTDEDCNLLASNSSRVMYNAHQEGIKRPFRITNFLRLNEQMKGQISLNAATHAFQVDIQLRSTWRIMIYTKEMLV